MGTYIETREKVAVWDKLPTSKENVVSRWIERILERLMRKIRAGQ